VGDTVIVETEDGERETYTIVGVAESNPAVGLISNESPMGLALLKSRVGDRVTVRAPDGQLEYRIVSAT
jgi:transcription elongation factor GreA